MSVDELNPTEDGLDELFGAGEGTPQPRWVLIISLLGGGILTAILGMACSAAPGGLVVLVAYAVLEKEMGRVESGYLPPENKPRLQILQTATYLSILAVVMLFVLQMYLLYNGFYDGFWGGLIGLIRSA